MLILFLSELMHYLTVTTTEHMVVDTTFSEKFRINLDVSFPALTCKGKYLVDNLRAIVTTTSF